MLARKPYWDYPDTWRSFRITRKNLPITGVSIIYLIEEMATGHCYIGATSNIYQRVSDHAKLAVSHYLSDINNAIRQKGREAFGIMPIYVCLNGSDGLYEAEASLIATYDSVIMGHNYYESEYDRKAHMSTLTQASWDNPTSRENRLKVGRRFSTRIKKSIANKGRIRVTNGTQEMFLPKSTPIPFGWRRGGVPRYKPERYIMPDAGRQRMYNANTGKIYITNGTANRMVYPTETIPTGWVRGMTR